MPEWPEMHCHNFHVEEQTWVRPYAPGSGRLVVLGWEAVAFTFLAWTTVRQFGITGFGVHVVAGVLAVLWGLGAWRVNQMGVYVGPAGMRLYGLLRTRKLGWGEIAHVRLHKATHKIGPWQIEGGMTVLIERHDGKTLNTELWAQGVDFHRRPRAFKEVYHHLRDRHLAAGNA